VCKHVDEMRTAFGNKIAVQFYQQLKLQNSSLNWYTFFQIYGYLPNIVCQKKPLILRAHKKPWAYVDEIIPELMSSLHRVK